MIVPLAIDCWGQSLFITANKRQIIEHIPFKPYLIMEKENRFLRSKPIRRIRIPDSGETTMYEVEDESIDKLEEKAKQLRMEGENIYKLPYLEQLYTDLPDYCLKYPNTQDLDIMYIDIEVLTTGDGIFPRSQKSPIIAIGYAINEGPTYIIDGLTKEKKTGDKNILTEFSRQLQEIDPDILVTYNGDSFDLPYIINRMLICGIDPVCLNRTKGKIIQDENEVRLRGRIHFDLIHSTRKDQSLFGIKSKGLKDVAKWYGYEPIELGQELSNTKKLMGTPQFREYLSSDINATRVVSKVYLPNMITLAEMMKVPLNATVGAFSSFIPKLLCARNCKKLNMIPLDTNKDRYGTKDADDVVQDEGRIFTLGSKYEGAIVEARKTGYFPHVYKIDFTSMYPSSIRTWNLGPDTTKIIAINDFENKYHFRRTDTCLFITFPDENFKKSITVQIDMTKVGFLKEEIERLSEERNRLKKLLKEAKIGAETEIYNSRQLAIKIILNSLYGYCSNKYATFGDMATGMTVTAMCRWTSRLVLEKIENAIINTDTDGYIVDREIDAGKLNKMIAEEIKKQQGCFSYMTLDPEPLLDGYFYRMKNYVVRKMKKGKVVMEKHGCAFKSSKQALVCDKVMDELCRRTLDQDMEDQFGLAQRMRNFANYNLNDFKYRLTFTKDLPAYGDRLSMQKVLGTQIEYRLKSKVEKGLQIEYYVTKKPPRCPLLDEIYQQAKRTKGPYYTISPYVTSVNELDKDYYLEQIDRLFGVFNWDYKLQTELLK